MITFFLFIADLLLSGLKPYRWMRGGKWNHICVTVPPYCFYWTKDDPISVERVIATEDYTQTPAAISPRE